MAIEPSKRARMRRVRFCAGGARALLRGEIISPALALLLLCVASASISAPATTGSIPPNIRAAVEDPMRPAADVSRDPHQKPAEVLTFIGVKPGDRVADFWPVPPYSTRLLSRAVGQGGHVYAILPEKLVREVPKAEADVRNNLSPYVNTTVMVQAFDEFSVPESLDLVYLGKIYHDFPNRAEMGPLDIAKLNRAVFRALKPGGVYVIVDHAAVPGSGYMDVEPDMSKRIHRIDPVLVKRQVESAGFVLQAQSRLLANPDDAHSLSVFDPSIRERTDRFIFKFRKPRK